MMKIIALIIFIAAIHLAGADSGNFTDFFWSKVAAVSLMGIAVFLGCVIKRGAGNGNSYSNQLY